MGFWNNFLAWFNSIPVVIWSGALGAVIASGISYFGVRSANKSSLARLRAQHDYDRDEAQKQRAHDALQKEEDRKAAIRREVYTKAAEEVHAVLAAIGGFPVKPLDMSGSSDADALQSFLKANAKVWLVAEAEAAHLSRELASQMGELYHKTMASAYPLRLAFEPVWDINRQLVHAEGEVQRIRVKLAELNEQAADSSARQAAQNSWVMANDWVVALKKSRQRTIDSLASERLAHIRATFDDMQVVQKTIVKLVSSLRKEIHLPADELEFLEQHADMEKRALDTINRAFGVVDVEKK
ncbi:hypothetical protein SAMN04515618_10887 [Collimonas sp. OK307]|uniref:hypothetical protein n=1 Tax=Collimonas sp. OK307 TaxID=1801620 RepID=UPI0008F3B2AC|nr:hypothetical protein [Collimonas sp. OK307]SFI02956.1 hypothetical protein SAMN04515618_10887 [Collimonas sp. OK307]